MRSAFLILVFMTMNFAVFSQFRQSIYGQPTEPTIEEKANDVTVPTATYRLFPTQNVWTFIKLNTRNGQMWQIQFDVGGDNRGVSYLNILSLVNLDDEVNDRFTLYPTQNMFNFILLDQLSGNTWQVQWSQEAKKRMIIPIE